MSTIKVDGIRSNSATSDAITLASNGTCTANITNNLSNRNLIINGAMQVAQRGTSSTSGGYQTVDRFSAYYTGGAMTQSQGSLTSGSPFEKGFTKYFRISNTTANTGTDGSRSIIVKLEAQDIANSGWNYKSSSSYLTFSFWVRSSVSQQFYIVIKTLDGTQQMYPFSIGTPSANTWTKVTHSIAGNSNLTFDSNNENGLQFYIYAFLGTDNTSSGVSLNGWSAWASSGRIPDMTNTWAATTDATFDITGVQLEVGSVATDFEHRSFAQELQLCKRYFQNHAPVSGDHMMWGVGRAEGNTGRIGLPVSVPMRAAPTVYAAKNRLMRYDGTGNDSTSTPSVFGASAWLSESNIYTIDFGGHSLSHNNMYMLTCSADSKITLSAEL